MTSECLFGLSCPQFLHHYGGGLICGHLSFCLHSLSTRQVSLLLISYRNCVHLYLLTVPYVYLWDAIGYLCSICLQAIGVIRAGQERCLGFWTLWKDLVLGPAPSLHSFSTRALGIVLTYPHTAPLEPVLCVMSIWSEENGHSYFYRKLRSRFYHRYFGCLYCGT